MRRRIFLTAMGAMAAAPLLKGEAAALSSAEDYWVSLSDGGDTVFVGKEVKTISLPPAAGFPSGTTIVLHNTDKRAKRLLGFPTDAMSFLWPSQRIGVEVHDGSWVISYNPGRWVLSEPLTIHVDPSVGNNDNDGLNLGAGNAMHTLQGAWDRIVTEIDTANFGVTIKAADGVYTTGLKAGPMPPVGGGLVNVVGNVKSPISALINPWLPNSIGFQAIGGATYIKVSGFCFDSPNLLCAFYSDISGSIETGHGLVFGAVAPNGVHFQASNGMIFINGNYEINGSAKYHVFAANSAFIEYGAGISVHLLGEPKFDFFAYAYGNATITALAAGVEFIGQARGQKYAAAVNGVVDVSGGSYEYLPGDSPGTTAKGGEYVF